MPHKGHRKDDEEGDDPVLEVEEEVEVKIAHIVKV